MFFNKISTVLLLASGLVSTSISSQALANTTWTEHKSEAKKGQATTVGVDINSATLDELMGLKGIGKKRAEAVLADRKRVGRFNRVEDLVRVKGFSEKQVLKILKQNQGTISAGK